MMIRHPDVQHKAQAEVDLITGGCWIPGLNDRWVHGQEGRAQFPYVECLVKELLRFNPVVPLVPHSVLEDQVYGGYLIPKGTWVMANIWCVRRLFLLLQNASERVLITRKCTL